MKYVVTIHDPKDVSFIRDENGVIIGTRIFNEIRLADNIAAVNSEGVKWLKLLATEEMLKGQAFGL